MADTQRAPRVEACIQNAMEKYAGGSPGRDLTYYQNVHQDLAPLARELENALSVANARIAELERATPPSPSTAPEVDERAAFEAWARQQPALDLSLLPESVEGMGVYRSGHTQWLYDGWQARAALASRPAAGNPVVGKRREIATKTAETRMDSDFHGGGQIASPPAEVDDEGLPDLPGSNFCAWVQHGKVWNAFPHGVGDKSIWDSNRYWTERGFDREPLFTAEQYRQGQRDAVAADRARRGAAGK